MLTRIESARPLDAAKAPVRLRVAFEDAHVGVVVKPQGMPTQKAPELGASAAQCIKFALTMQPVPGARPLYHVIDLPGRWAYTGGFAGV